MLLLRNSADTVFLLLMRATCSTIFISKCKLKISNMPTQMQVTLIKLSKCISSPKILKANQMLISYFPHITLLLLCTDPCVLNLLMPNRQTNSTNIKTSKGKFIKEAQQSGTTKYADITDKRCCSFSYFVLLKMDDSDARNM